MNNNMSGTDFATMISQKKRREQKGDKWNLGIENQELEWFKQKKKNDKWDIGISDISKF